MLPRTGTMRIMRKTTIPKGPVAPWLVYSKNRSAISGKFKEDTCFFLTDSKSSRHLDHKRAQERRNPNIFAAAVSFTLTLEIKHFTVLSPLSDNVRVVFDASELRYSWPPGPTGVWPCSYHRRSLLQAPKHHPYSRFRPRGHRAICLLHVALFTVNI